MGRLTTIHLSLILGFFKCLPFRVCLTNSSETALAVLLIYTRSFSWWVHFFGWWNSIYANKQPPYLHKVYADVTTVRKHCEHTPDTPFYNHGNKTAHPRPNPCLEQPRHLYKTDTKARHLRLLPESTCLLIKWAWFQRLMDVVWMDVRPCYANW